MELKPGRILKKRYRIERKIHEGGMGIVYLCKDIVYGGLYVVKHPRYDEGNVAIKVEKLKVEANILKTLSHPHIGKYIDSFEENNVFYMIIEYVDGEDLKTLFQKGPAPESQVRQYGNQLLNALEYLHNCNIIHRDIKPRNVMITRNTVKLIDFGGAKMRFTGLRQKGTILYTPGYGAPEQQAGECYYQSDIFGVGAVLFFLLTGEDPCSIPPLSPCTENPLVNTMLDAVVRKATAMDPNYRFQTATEMKKALSGIATPVTYTPRLIIGSKEVKISKSPLTIGRGGINVYPDITIRDTEKFISRIHAKIFTDSKGNYWIEDYSVNGTFVYTGRGYKKIKRWNLRDNDLVAFCYSSTRGPYLSLKFKTH